MIAFHFVNKVPYLFLVLFHTSNSKKITTDDAVIYEKLQEKLPLPLPGPSIFDYQNSDGSKVKRANVHPRYYEMIGDEMYVFEPSPLGMNPFLAAIHSDFETTRHAYPKNAQLQENHRPQQPQPHSSTFQEQRNNIKQNVQPKHNHLQKSPIQHPQALTQESLLVPYPCPIQVIEKIPIMIPHSHSNFNSNRQPSQFNSQFSKPFIHPVTPKDAIPSQRALNFERNIIHSNTNENEDNSASTSSFNHLYGDCTTSNDKEGRCVSFKVCYPVVFNMIDGRLKNHGLAKILYQAAGPCDEDGEWKSNKKVIPGIVENDPEIPQNYYNQTICCAGYHLKNNYIQQTPPESKIMKPSPPDPRLSPPEFQDNTNTKQYESYEIQDPSDTESSIGESDSDYYIDEYDSFIFSTSETPKLVPKKKFGKNKNDTTSSIASDMNTKEKNNDYTQNKSESNKFEVKVEKNSKSNDESTEPESSPNTLKKKVKPNQPQSKEASKLQIPRNVSTNTTNETEILDLTTMDEPDLSAWKCPGRQIRMPRGHWPWMVALFYFGNHFCSGALLDHRHILTSSSCIDRFQGKDLNRMRVILGDRVIFSAIDGPHSWRKILRITRHLKFDPATMENDIAIVEMEYPVSYTQNIQPINLAVSMNRSHVSRAIISGWSGADIGKRYFAPRTTTDSVVEFMDLDECKRSFNGFLENGIPQNVICTKPSNTSCMVDPGAPLVMKTNNCWHLIGILSHGLRCGSFPEIFTNIIEFIPWIQKNIRPKLKA